MNIFKNPALNRWLTTTDHKDVGMMYFFATLLFGFIGLVLSLLIRIQLYQPNNGTAWLDWAPGDDAGAFYNSIVTMHGAVMVLFFVSPLSFGFANYVVPLQIGAKDMAFPRLNALSFWTFLFGGLVAASGFLFGGAADVGWTFYSPLTSLEYSPGNGVNLAGAGLVLLIISVTASTINFIVTILYHRVPEMDIWEMPMFTWSMLFTVILMLTIFPILLGALLMLVGDRLFETVFFIDENRGSILWGHLFWFFGHPEVYVVLLPELGMLAEIIPVFSKKPLYGKRYIIYSLIIGTFLSVLVWVHHMFITGIDPLLREVMSITTELISIPFAVIMICLIATLYNGKITFPTPNLFALGAIGIFVIGGVTGVFLSSAAIDYHLRGTYYIVAHFHYTLGAVVLGVVAAIYYWYPLMFGRILDERLGKLHFWGSFFGTILTMTPLFYLTDMPRRVYVYGANEHELVWGDYHFLATIGALVVFFAQLVFLYNLIRSYSHGREAGSNPWNGSTQEWAGK